MFRTSYPAPAWAMAGSNRRRDGPGEHGVAKEEKLPEASTDALKMLQVHRRTGWRTTKSNSRTDTAPNGQQMPQLTDISYQLANHSGHLEEAASLATNCNTLQPSDKQTPGTTGITGTTGIAGTTGTTGAKGTTGQQVQQVQHVQQDNWWTTSNRIPHTSSGPVGVQRTTGT